LFTCRALSADKTSKVATNPTVDEINVVAAGLVLLVLAGADTTKAHTILGSYNPHGIN
jgi:hypothetical protein